jgi:hypothetical protein
VFVKELKNNTETTRRIEVHQQNIAAAVVVM